MNSDLQNEHKLVNIYAWYRFLLALLMLAIFFVISGQRLLSTFYPGLYLATTCVYAVLNLLLLIWSRKPLRGRIRPRYYFFLFMSDVAALILVTHASGGTNSGFPILLAVTTSAAAIFLSGQLAFLVAAVATLAVLAETLYGILTLRATLGSLLPAGLLGTLMFTATIVVQTVARRMRVTEELAEQRSEEVFSLQQLNQLIVQRLRTGILVVDSTLRIQLMNEEARKLLGEDNPTELPGSLRASLRSWRAGDQRSMPPLRLRDSGPTVQLNFATLQYPGGDSTIVFLEDFARINQQAQQLKLASLGRLTASIAHEIRNPLGAISHAAQLLREEETLTDAESQLVDIILNHGKRMNEVIENVLYLSRGHQPRPEQLDLESWLKSFVSDFHYQGNLNAKIDLRVERDNVRIDADPRHLRQVLTNLCQNGLRYSERNTGEASLSLHVHGGKDDQSAVLDIVDDGAGITEEDSERIFEPFFTTELEGTGLGLYLARELCEANQVEIAYLRNEQDKSCFRLRFVIAAPNATVAKRSESAV